MAALFYLSCSLLMPHFVYILQSEKDGRYYIGETHDIGGRVAFHNAGLQRSTRSRIPFKLLYVEQWPNRGEALKREKEIKNYKGGRSFKKLLEGSSPA